MRLFDSHCHFLDLSAEEIEAHLRRAKESGVEALLAVGGSAALDATALLAARISVGRADLPIVFTACGRDRDQLDGSPCEVSPEAVSAWGEVGLDYYYSPETRKRQFEHFLNQLEIASQAGLPVVIHTREADEDTLEALRKIPSKGVIHCFTGSPQFCRKLLDLGFFISISGIVTFRNADNVRESARLIPLEYLMVETDSPFLAPIPMRGKANEPAFVAHTLRFLAQTRGEDEEELAETTFSNAWRLFSRR